MGCFSSKAAEPLISKGGGHAGPTSAQLAPAAGQSVAGQSTARMPDPEALKSDDPDILRRALASCYSHGGRGCEVTVLADAEERLRSAKQLPEDWHLPTYCAGQVLEGSSGGRQASTVVAYQKQPESVVQAVQALFDGTYRKVYTRDRRGAPIPDRFVVKEVHRVMNDQVWKEYQVRVRQVAEARRAETLSVPGGATTMNVISQRGLAALPRLDKSVNEVWLFHGTTGAAAKGIAENDFRLDFSGSNAGTLYGKGIYLAENASKSDEYGEGPKGPANQEMEMGFEAPRPPPGPPPPLVRESYIMLCRSVLGRMNYTDEKRPNPDNLQQSCLNGSFDSVLGDRLKINKTFREIVVYHDDNVYPEYIVRYERIFFHERFAQVYAAMLKRQKQGRFKGATKEELEVLSSLWGVYSMPHGGKINKWQLLDLLLAIFQPPADEGPDLDATFADWDTKKDGVIDWEEFLQEVHQRVRDGIECSGPERFADIYQGMLQRQKAGHFRGATVGEKCVMTMVWYQFAKNQRTIDKWQLLELLKAINQPPADERGDLDSTFADIDTKRDGVIDYDEFLKEIEQRVEDGFEG